MGLQLEDMTKKYISFLIVDFGMAHCDIYSALADRCYNFTFK